MNRLDRFLHTVDAVNDGIGKVIRWLIIGITVVVLAEVVSRYVFNHTFIWTHETSKFIFGTYSVLGGAYALLWGAHVKVDILHRRLSVRTQAIVDLATASVFFFVCVILLWQGWLLFWRSFTVDAHSWSVWGPPLAPVHAMIPLACFLLLMQGAAHYIRILRVARGTKKGEE